MMSIRALGLGSTLRRTAFSPSFGKSTRIFKYFDISHSSCVSSTQPSRIAEHSWETVSGYSTDLYREFCLILRSSSVQIQSLPSSANTEILNKQRLNRPSSPHFTIYQPQLTWIASIANRVTGAGLSVCALLPLFVTNEAHNYSYYYPSALRILYCVPFRSGNL